LASLAAADDAGPAGSGLNHFGLFSTAGRMRSVKKRELVRRGLADWFSLPGAAWPERYWGDWCDAGTAVADWGKSGASTAVFEGIRTSDRTLFLCKK
jgi:hypothetical protein